MIAVFVFFFLLVIGTPIALVVLFTSLVGTLTYTTTAPNVVIAQMFAGMDTTTLLAVPFFIVAGMIASKGKTSEKLVRGHEPDFRLDSPAARDLSTISPARSSPQSAVPLWPP